MNNKNSNNIRFIAEVGIFVALGLVFDFLAQFYSSAIWPFGGSVSLAMLPIFIISYRYGLKGGIITGGLIGTIQMLWAGSGIIHWSQALLDYSLAYGVVGIAGIFSKIILKNENLKIKLFFSNLGIFLGGILRLIAHVASGYIFFKEYAGSTDPKAIFLYSFTYNLGYMAISIVIIMIVMNVIILNYYQLIAGDFK